MRSPCVLVPSSLRLRNNGYPLHTEKDLHHLERCSKSEHVPLNWNGSSLVPRVGFRNIRGSVIVIVPSFASREELRVARGQPKRGYLRRDEVNRGQVSLKVRFPIRDCA